MNTTNLPTLIAVHVHAGRTVTLTLGTGRRVIVATAAPALFASDLGVLIVHGKGYAVPAALFAELRQALKLEGVSACAALNLYRPQEGPPVLTLTGINRQPNAVTFTALDSEGQAVALTMPRPVFVRPGFPMPRPAGVPVHLTVTREDTPPGESVRFVIYPETPEGSAVLELLGYSARADASSERGQA